MRLAVLTFAALVPIASTVIAQTSPSTLPGGASSLQESYDDWRVFCMEPTGQKICILSQQQIDGRTRQRILALERRCHINNFYLPILPMSPMQCHAISMT